MTERSLQVTYRKGRTFAAYLRLSHAAGGRPVGVEITAPQAVPLERLNQLLAELGEPAMAEQDYTPARAA
jgi:hypothetical protein